MSIVGRLLKSVVGEMIMVWTRAMVSGGQVWECVQDLVNLWIWGSKGEGGAEEMSLPGFRLRWSRKM